MWWRSRACRWAARRVQTALDDDPDGRLSLGDLDRLVAHVSVCRYCRAMVDDYRRLAASLSRLAARRAPDPAALRRLLQLTAGLAPEEPT